MQQKDTSESNGMVLAEINTAVSLIKVVPWNAVFRRVKTLFSARMTIIGPEASGKSTLVQVLYNAGNLVDVRDHKRTPKISGKGALEVTFSGPTGESHLLLRSIWDTPGQRDDVANDVARHIASYKPRVLVFVLDMKRAFNGPQDQAELDTGKWFDDLKAYADQVEEGEGFRKALKRVKCVVVMLNKINLVYDQLSDQYRLDRKGIADELLKKRKDEYQNKAISKIQELFGKAGLNFTTDNISFIGCCLVNYAEYDNKKKASDDFDSGHLEMLKIVNNDLRRNG